MSRINLSVFTFKWWHIVLGLFFVWLVLLLWPIKSLLLPHNWWGQSLIVVLNENEARPCGGFATAYGVLELPLISLKTENTYALEADLGPAPKPLTQVSERLKFWDLGTSSDLHKCAADFKAGYYANTNQTVDRVILVSLGFLERWAQLLGNETFFADISRSVANIDRHDETSLENRKDAAGGMIGPLIKVTVLNPVKFLQFSNLLGNHLVQKRVFLSNKKSLSEVPRALISIQEWNLGGGKSSRYLHKNWAIDLRETKPNVWVAQLNLSIKHLGSYDEPLSQIWRGSFELNLFGKSHLIPAEIKPGGIFNYQADYVITNFEDNLLLAVAPHQDWQTRLSVAPIAQQKISSPNLETRESVGVWSGRITDKPKNFSWIISPDRSPPFLTLHKPIDAAVLAPEILTELNYEGGDLLTEIHFNELVVLPSTTVGTQLIDRDYEVTSITENPELKGFKLLDDQVTLLLNWSQNQYQKDERFNLRLGGVVDIWGNPLQEDPRTIITR